MLRTLSLVVSLLVAAPAAAQDRTLKILLGYPPGASSDTPTRLLAERMRALGFKPGQ